jgi:hypothetical protein
MSDNAAIEAKIAELEAEMARTQKNKATNYRKSIFGCLIFFDSVVLQSLF